MAVETAERSHLDLLRAESSHLDLQGQGSEHTGKVARLLEAQILHLVTHLLEQGHPC